jgi:hypothetical protein
MAMRLSLIALGGAVVMVGGCNAIHTFREDAIASKAPPSAAVKDCGKGAAGCPPVNRKQYYDDHTARYYYFDPSTGRYYWENGEPRF